MEPRPVPKGKIINRLLFAREKMEPNFRIDPTTGEVIEAEGEGSGEAPSFDWVWEKLKEAQRPGWLRAVSEDLGGELGEEWGVKNVEYARGGEASSVRCEFFHRKVHKDKLEIRVSARLTRNQLWLLALYETVRLNGYGGGGLK